MKIYTKQGDQGQTALIGGDRVSKHSIRIETYGTVDELNSILGVAIANEHQQFTGDVINEVQHQLFILGADLATPFHSDARIDRISEQEVQYLEQKIDFMEESLPPLKNFILPSGSMTGATLHHARTVCRRAERLAVVCSNQEKINDMVLQYLNRLSDFLFVLARYENHQNGCLENPWIPKK